MKVSDGSQPPATPASPLGVPAGSRSLERLVGPSIVISTQLKNVSTFRSGISCHRKKWHLINVWQSVVLEVYVKLVLVPGAVSGFLEWMIRKVVEEEEDSDTNRLTVLVDYGSPLTTVVTAFLSKVKSANRGLPPQQDLIPFKLKVAPVSNNGVHASNAKISDRSQPSLTLDLSRRESAGSDSLHCLVRSLRSSYSPL